jgi:hypothetical protein
MMRRELFHNEWVFSVMPNILKKMLATVIVFGLAVLFLTLTGCGKHESPWRRRIGRRFFWLEHRWSLRVWIRIMQPHRRSLKFFWLCLKDW